MPNPSEHPIPRPIPVDELPPVELPEELRPPEPSPFWLTQVQSGENFELGAVFKRTYDFDRSGVCTLADTQLPLAFAAEPHDEELSPLGVSMRTMPETAPVKNGTDIVLKALALSPRPVTSMEVGLRIGRLHHRAMVIGDRVVDTVAGKIVFSDPAPFESLPLRYELAYGGKDESFLQAVIEEVKKMVSEQDLRRSQQVLKKQMWNGPFFVYARNRYGKGYVVDGRAEWIQGRELPNMERPDDLLTPENIVVGDPLTWDKQPLPVGFDYLDISMFPQSAMLGLLPPRRDESAPLPEAQSGLIPSDFQPVNLLYAKPEDLPKALHPDAVRFASLGLRAPMLRDVDTVQLEGMDPDRPTFRLHLPKEKVFFEAPFLPRPNRRFDASPTLLHIDMNTQKIFVVWAGRAPLSRPYMPDQIKAMQEEIRIGLHTA